MKIELNDFAHITMFVSGRERAMRRFSYLHQPPFPNDNEDFPLFEEAGEILAKDGYISGQSEHREHLLWIVD